MNVSIVTFPFIELPGNFVILIEGKISVHELEHSVGDSLMWTSNIVLASWR